jgi:GT2 family glycosyltransferase
MILFATSAGDGPLNRSLERQTSSEWQTLTLVGEDQTDSLTHITASGASHVAFLDDRDVCSSDAVRAVLDTASADPLIDVIYCDEDTIEDGVRTAPFLKPGWSPERFRAQNYLGRSVWYSVRFIEDVAGGIANLAASIPDARRIAHIPRTLVHLGAPQEFAICPEPPCHTSASISVVIPTGGVEGWVDETEVVHVNHAIRSLMQQSTALDLEIVVVLDRTTDSEVLGDLVELPNLSVVQDSEQFNFSRACNMGARQSSGQVLLFLNDDTECVDGAALHRLGETALRRQIGAVGPHLLFGDGRLQHAGIWARAGIPGHRYPGLSADFTGLNNSLLVPQNSVAVTGACLAVEANRFWSVGGFDENFPLNFNDVDLCLRLLRSGYRTVVEPIRAFRHFESATREPAATSEEYVLLRDLWEPELSEDFWDHPRHKSPAPNEYPPPTPAYIEAIEPLARTTLRPRVWDTARGKPVNWPHRDAESG